MLNPRLVYLLLFVFLVSGCAAKSPENLLSRYEIEHQSLSKVSVCVSYGCRHKEVAYITEAEWKQVVDVMKAEGLDSASKERQRISSGVGLLERIIGPKVGTEHNKGRNHDSPAGHRQLDCIADSVNTTNYLLLMSKHELLAFHQIAAPVKRGILNFNFPHHSAAIKNVKTKKVYAVDPWFNDNGQPAEVVPLELWMAGYKPD